MLRMNNITREGRIVLSDLKYVELSPKECAKYEVRDGDLLFNRTNSRELVGKTAVWRHGAGYVAAGYLICVRFKQDTAHPEYVSSVLNSPWGKQMLFTRAKTSGNMCNISASDFKRFEIPLPPLAEQKRIAGILEAVDALRAKRREALAQLDTLLQATFLELLGDPIANPKNWDTRTLPELILPGKNSLKRGPFGGALKKEIFVDSGYLVYEQHHALNNDYSFGRYFITEEKYKELFGFSVKPNDIIISCSGVYLGKLSIVPDGAKPGVINQALLKVSLDQEKMKTVVFAYIFGSPQFKQKYFPSNRGVAIPNLPPMDVMKKIGFITPPVEVQQQFTAIVESIEQQKARMRAHLAELDTLFASLQSRAFRGEF